MWEKALFTLQVKAFRVESEAEKFMDELDEAWPELPTRIIGGMSNSRPIYRVMLGAFKDRSSATEIKNQFVTRFGKVDRPFIKSLR